MDIQINHWYLIKSTHGVPSILWVKELDPDGRSFLNHLDLAWVAIPKHWNIEAELTADSRIVIEGKKRYYERTIKVTVEEEEIFIEYDGYEVVKWVQSEWLDEPTLCSAIANAICMAYTAPERLIELNIKHIESQKAIKKGDNNGRT